MAKRSSLLVVDGAVHVCEPSVRGRVFEKCPRGVGVLHEAQTGWRLWLLISCSLALWFSLFAGAQAALGVPSFQITGLSIQNGNVVLSWQGGGATNQVQSATSLAGPWQDLGLPTTGSTMVTPLAGPLGFYRLVIATNSVAARPSQCTYSVSPSSASFGSGAGSSSGASSPW